MQATELGIWVSNIPSLATGNALSCAEHAVLLMLATLRDLAGMQASIQQVSRRSGSRDCGGGLPAAPRTDSARSPLEPA